MNEISMAEILEQIQFMQVDWDWHKEQVENSRQGKYAVYSDPFGPKKRLVDIVSMHLKAEGYIPSIIFRMNHTNNTRYYFVPIDPPRPLMIMSRHIKITCAVPDIA